MTEMQNPIFDDEKEFLERQRQEYKNALLSDVAVIKDNSAEIGKKVLLAGGALAGVWLASRLLFGKKKKKKNKKSRKAQRQLAESSETTYPIAQTFLHPQSAPASYAASQDVEFGSPLDFNLPSSKGTQARILNPTQPFPPAAGGNYSVHSHYHAAPDAPGESQPQQSVAGEIIKAVATQVAAFLLVYLSKKAEEFLLKNADIAENAPDTTDVDFSYEADAGKQYL